MPHSLTTAFLSLTPACMLTAGLLAWIWHTTDRERFIASWAMAAALTAFSFLLFGLRGALPTLPVILAANVALHTGHMLLWAGARWLRGAAVPLWILPLPSLLWVSACAVPGFLDSAPARLTLASALLTAEALAIMAELWRGTRCGRTGSLVVLMAGATLLHAMIQAMQLAVLLWTGRVTPVSYFALVMGGPIFVVIGFLCFALANTRTAERDAALVAEGRLREAVLRAEQARREAAALLAGRAEVERLHTGLPAHIFVREVNAAGDTRLLYRGGDVEAVTGWPPDRLVGIDNLATFAEDPHIVTEAFQAALQRGAAATDWRMRRLDGGWSWLRTSWTVQEREPNGRTVLVGYSINVTAEREASARAAASGRLASLGEMATGLAHELKQPLQSILLGAELSQASARRICATEIGEQLELVINQAIRAGGIINNLRRFAQGDPDGAPVEPIAPRQAVAHVLPLMDGLLREAGVRVEICLPEDLPAMLGHPIALEQVLTNLLLNARDAMVEGPAQLDRCVTLRGRALGGKVQLDVADTGGGIRHEVATRLFEPFVTTKGPDRGTGLGLSISHGLMEAMGGRIEARNAERGAVFTITLPAAGAEAGARA